MVLVARPGTHPHTRAAHKQLRTELPAFEVWVTLDRALCGADSTGILRRAGQAPPWRAPRALHPGKAGTEHRPQAGDSAQQLVSCLMVTPAGLHLRPPASQRSKLQPVLDQNSTDKGASPNFREKNRQLIEIRGFFPRKES